MDAGKTALFSTGSLAGTGVIFIVLGIPMAQGEVAPNGSYGVRTAKTAMSEELWYAINAPSGVALAVAGGVIAVGCVVLYAVYGSSHPNRVVYGNIGVYLASSVIALLAMVWINRAA